MTSLWKEGNNTTQAIIEDIPLKDLGNLGKELLKLKIDEDAKVDLILGVIENE
jgi:hypothetical protein